MFAELVADDEEPGLELGRGPPLQLGVEAPQRRQEPTKRNVRAPRAETFRKLLQNGLKII